MPKRKKPEPSDAAGSAAWRDYPDGHPLAFEREIRALRRALDEQKAANEVLHEKLDAADDRLDLVLSIDPKRKTTAKIRPRRRRAQEATAVCLASDWHVGELVDPASVNGRNTYNPEVAQVRAERFFQNSARLIELARDGVKIDDVILWLGGDLVTGYIHEELVESNTMSPTEEFLFCMDLLTAGIDFLLDRVKPKRLLVPCNYGNHGRLTHTRRISTGAKNSLEWLLYHALARHYKSTPAVEFLVSDGSHLYVDVYDFPIRWTHGDDVRYYGGVGGLSIPLRKATDAWDTYRDATYTVFGHYHQRCDFGFAIGNGSLIGYNAFALSVKARFEEPQQAFFLIDRERGKTLVAPIHVT
jgi:hypothetical protein